MDPRKDMAVSRLLALTDEMILEQRAGNRALALGYLLSTIEATQGREDDPRYLLLRIQCVDRLVKLLRLNELDPVDSIEVVPDAARTRALVAGQLDALEARMRPTEAGDGDEGS